MFISSIILEGIAIFIAVLALIMTIVVSRSQKEHEKTIAQISVRPYADFLFLQSNIKMFVKIANFGMGPMIVRSLTVTMDGEPIDDIISCFGSKQIRVKRIAEYYSYDYSHITSGERVISPNSEYALFSLSLREKEESIKDDEFRTLVAEITDTLRRIHIKVVYEDIYGNEFSRERYLRNFFNERYTEFLPWLPV